MHRAKKHLCGCCLKYNIYAANVDGRDGIVNLAHCCNRFQLFLFTLGLADGLQICSLLSWPQKVSGFCVLASACPLQFRCILAFHTVHSDSVLGGSRRCSCCSSRGHLHNPHLADEAFDCTPWRDQLLQLFYYALGEQLLQGQLVLYCHKNYSWLLDQSSLLTVKGQFLSKYSQCQFAAVDLDFEISSSLLV